MRAYSLIICLFLSQNLFAEIVVETDRLIVRDVVPSDEGYFIAMQVEPKMEEFLGKRDPEFSKKIFLISTRSEGAFFYAVEKKGYAKPLGFLGFVRYPSEVYHTIELFFEEGSQDLGYGKESMTAIVAFLFRTKDVEGMVWLARATNERSNRLAEKLGFLPMRDVMLSSGHPAFEHRLSALRYLGNMLEGNPPPAEARTIPVSQYRRQLQRMANRDVSPEEISILVESPAPGRIAVLWQSAARKACSTLKWLIELGL